MSEASKALISFNAGEFSPKLFSRMDLEKSGAACRVLENMIVESYGQAKRRPGTKFLGVAGGDFIDGVLPTGPGSMLLRVDRLYDSAGLRLTHGKMDCLKTTTTYGISFVSRAGAGCLIGFNEFEDIPNGIVASTPKKKYLHKEFTQLSTFSLGIGVPVGHCSCNAQIYTGNYSGANFYEPDTGTYHGDAIFTAIGGGADCIPDDPPTVSPVGDLPDHYYGSVAHQPCIYTESTTFKRMLAGPPCNPSCYDYGSLDSYIPAGEATEELSNEDTFANALRRAGAPTATAADSLLATQTSDFCYTGHSSEWETVFTDLKVGCSYTFTIEYTQGPTTITEEYTFVATSTTETLNGVLPAILGTTTAAAAATLYVT